MTKITALKHSALESCKLRCHDMKPFRNHSYGVWVAQCRICGMEATVKEHPAPNEIDIGGEAVALDCKGRFP